MRIPRFTAPQPHRFHDGGLPATDGRPEVPPSPDRPMQIVLTRVDEHQQETFHLDRRIAYDDEVFGQLVVPTDPATWETDLTSVPMIFTWLVPKTGQHLPAALIHDGLIWNPARESQSYVSTAGHTLLRPEADRVLRAAMRDTGTGAIRRWLVWSAVTVATMVSGRGTGWSRGEAIRYRWTAILTVLLITYLGYCATGDLFDRHPFGAVGLPWMGDRPWWLEALGGLAGAVVIPFVVGIAWGRFHTAGWVTGIALAVLVHVTAAVLLVTALYQTMEWLVRRSAATASLLGLAVVAASAVLFVVLVT